MIIGLAVAPKETVELLRAEADHIEVVTAPSSFFNTEKSERGDYGWVLRNFNACFPSSVNEIM